MSQEQFQQIILDRLDRFEDHFDKIDNRLESIDNRLREVEIKVGKLEERKLVISTLRDWFVYGVALAAMAIAWLK